MAEQISVDVVYHFLPKYREGVFRELLACEDLDVRFISGTSRPGQEHIPAAEGISYVDVQNRWRGMVLWQSGLLGLLRRRKPDVVIFLGSWTFGSTWAAALLARLSGTTVLFWTHGWRSEEVGMRKLVRDSFYKLAHGLLLYGKRASVIGQEHGFAEERLFVIGNSLGVTPPSGASRIELDTSPPMILWVARLLENKRLDLLIEAAGVVHKRGHDLAVVIVGDGSAPRPVPLPEIESNIQYLGSIHDDEVLRDLFDRASAVAIPASAGLTVLHAMLHGTPVIVNDDPTQNGPEYEFVEDGVNGSTFPVADVEALADELVRWAIEHPASPEQRLAIASQGKVAASPVEGARRIRAAIEVARSR